jgi:hypothetical protein
MHKARCLWAVRNILKDGVSVFAGMVAAPVNANDVPISLAESVIQRNSSSNPLAASYD